jgi:PIN domain nuclease of toxin-antitoxin system
MNVAYVDASALVAIVFGEAGATATIRQLDTFDELFSSNLLEAELMASLAREQVSLQLDSLSWISWVLPDRPLTAEFSRVLAAGYLRGADLWHMACALYLADDPGAVSFVTLDKQQRTVARTLGFKVAARG